MEKYGIVAEKLAKELLLEIFNDNGFSASKSKDKEAGIWLEIGKGKYIEIEFSLNKNSILGSKGVEDIHMGIVPMWVDEKELEISFVQKNGKEMIKKVITLIKKIIKSFDLRTFEKPNLA